MGFFPYTLGVVTREYYKLFLNMNRLDPYQLGALRTIITGLFLFVAGYKSIKSIIFVTFKHNKCCLNEQ